MHVNYKVLSWKLVGKKEKLITYNKVGFATSVRRMEELDNMVLCILSEAEF